MLHFLSLETKAAYGTEVPVVLFGNLYFLTGQKLAISPINSENILGNILHLFRRNL
jgi:hypothetical protein